MSAGGPKHCELCDLPLAQCVHGLQRRTKKAAPASRTGSATSGGKRRGGKKKGSAPVGGPVLKCAECGRRARYGRYRLCLQCGISAGFRVCSRCGRYFQPDVSIGAKKKMSCKTCKKRRGGSVWVTGSAGSPTLGCRR